VQNAPGVAIVEASEHLDPEEPDIGLADPRDARLRQRFHVLAQVLLHILEYQCQHTVKRREQENGMGMRRKKDGMG